jgi:TRAP-type mannitol/chloroaromatic compound transport system substrate-binding protein
MQRYKWTCLILAMAFFSITTIAQAADAPAKKIILKVPVCFATSLPVIGDSAVWLADNLKTASGGSIKMKIFEPGKLLPPFEILEAVSDGKINAGLASAAYWQGKMPAASFFSSVPFGPEAPEYLAWIYQGNGLKLYQEMYDRAGFAVKVLPVFIISPETSGWFAKPIETVDDLKGLRMRFFGFGGKAMQELGVSVSLMPAGEIFPALEKGAIDATEFSFPAIDEKLGFYKVAKYNYYPGWHQQATLLELLINKKTWEKMSPGQQKLLEMTAMAGITHTLAYSEAIQGAVIRKNAEERGVKNMTWSPEMLAAFKAAWEKVVAQEAAKDEFFKRVWEDLSKFREDYAYWSSRGFLPRGN